MAGGRGRGRGGRDREPLPRPVQISKKLSWLLRHGAEDEGLQLGEGGFANLQDVLNNRKLRGLKISLDEVRQIVQDNDKQRFTLVPVSEGGEDMNGQATLPSDKSRDWLIRANQGHSVQVESEGLLQPITAENMPETIVHGTSHAAWTYIAASGGLKRMYRNHIHFASGLPAGFRSIVDQEQDDVAAPVISGMRSYSTVLIFVDIRMAMDAGLKFWRSDNGVILCEGNRDGLLPMDFFSRVEDRKGAGVLVENGKVVKEAPAHWKPKEKG